MLTSFHTHTELCKHADGSVADYVLQATSDGCKALGFSDHCPYPDSVWQEVRMTVEQSKLYMNEVYHSADGATFPIYAGFECEWAPQYDSWYRDYLLAELGADYLVYGPHWVWHDSRSEYVYIPQVRDTALLHSYTELTIEGINSGLFCFVAHPDLMLANGLSWNADTRVCLGAIIDAAVDCGLPLEINGLGMSRPLVSGENGMRYQYPVEQFWELAAQKGALAVCNSDAHTPGDVIRLSEKARAFAAQFDICVIDNPVEYQKKQRVSGTDK